MGIEPSTRAGGYGDWTQYWEELGAEQPCPLKNSSVKGGEQEMDEVPLTELIQ